MTTQIDIPIGTPVLAYPGVRPEDPLYAEHGRVLDTVTRSSVWPLGDGTPVVKVEGYSGGIALTHIDVRHPVDEKLAGAVAAFRDIQGQHRAEPRPALYGRAGTMENRCVVCNRPAPCSTWQTAQAQIEKLVA